MAAHAACVGQGMIDVPFSLTAFVSGREQNVSSHGLIENYERARQMQVLLQSNRFTPYISLLVVVFVAWLGHGAMGWARALAWCMPLAVVAVLYALDSDRHRCLDLSELGKASVRWRFVTHVAAQAIGYGIMNIGLYSQLERDGQFLLAVIDTAALPIGAFTVAAVLEIGLAWVVPLSFLFTLNMLIQGSAFYNVLAIGCIFTGVVSSVTIVSISRGMQARLQAESEAIEGREAIGVLLQDIESQSDDWVWGVDADLRLAHAALPLLLALGEGEAQTLLGQPLLPLLESRSGHSADDRAKLAALERMLAEPFPLRNLEFNVIPAASDGKPAVWSISGVPVRHADGQSRGWRGVIRDITLLRSQAEELHRLAHTDSLTGLTNRHILLEACRDAIDRIVPLDGLIPLSFYLLDLDDFKGVNDTFGHQTGDLMLQKVAQLLQEAVAHQYLTRDAVLARLGGDEFALLVTEPHTASDREAIGWALAARLRPTWVSETLRVDVRSSIGISSWQRPGTAAEDLLRDADVAMYEVKASGGAAVLVYEDEMGARVARRAECSEELGRLIAHQGSEGFAPGQAGELKMLYQPQIELRSGQLIGAEALIRWQHPARGWISPGDFIPIAEDTGLIVPLGQWVMERSCLEAAEWDDSLRVAVNVSGHQFADPLFLPTVRRALHLTGLPARRLEVEITETALMTNPEQARATLLELRRLGVTIALDDFGTGYSSLAYLATLPVDLVKIDRSFVIAMSQDPFVETVVIYILELCRALGVKTLAEGIETPEQAALLLQHGCDYGQGFLYDKSIAASAIVPRRYRVLGPEAPSVVRAAS